MQEVIWRRKRGPLGPLPLYDKVGGGGRVCFAPSPILGLLANNIRHIFFLMFSELCAHIILTDLIAPPPTERSFLRL